jgi:hypothetical protein
MYDSDSGVQHILYGGKIPVQNCAILKNHLLRKADWKYFSRNFFLIVFYGPEKKIWGRYQ